VGVVTGFSETISLSEKVDDVTNSHRPVGSYSGEAVSFVLRDILQFSSSKEDAIQIAQGAKRTWSVWLGFGDYASQRFNAVLYDQEAAIPYDDHTLPKRTNQTEFDGVAYIDKHPQPSAHPVFPGLIRQFYGNLTAEIVATNIPRLMQSGDVHIAVTDFVKRRGFVATGTTDGPAGNFTRFAYEAPFLQFDLPKLWAEPAP